MFEAGLRRRGGPPGPAAAEIRPADTPAGLAAKAARVAPSERQLRWQALEFQAFVHFGMNTFTDREWGEGTEDPKLFDPSDFDAGQWAEAVQAAGIRGLIVTAKHHDGFCLWPSGFTGHRSRARPGRTGRATSSARSPRPAGRPAWRSASTSRPGTATSRATGIAPLQRALQEPAPRAPDAVRGHFRGLVRRRVRRGPERQTAGLRLDRLFRPHPGAPAGRRHLHHGPGRPLDRQRGRGHPGERMERHPRRRASTTCPPRRTPAASPVSTPRPPTSAPGTGSRPRPDKAGGLSGIPARSTSPSVPAGSITRPRTAKSRRSIISSISTTPRSEATPSFC